MMRIKTALSDLHVRTNFPPLLIYTFCTNVINTSELFVLVDVYDESIIRFLGTVLEAN